MKKKSIIFILPLLILGLIFFVNTNKKYWDGESKVASVDQEENGDTTVILRDPILDEIISFIIPGETEVVVARSLGTMRLKNVWQLGVNEGVGGELVAKTIMSNFLFPVSLWIDANERTNIPLVDRIIMKLFDLQIKDIDRTEINLAQSLFLKKGMLTDGESGYKLNGGPPERLTSYFVDDNFEGMEVYIKDASGKLGVAEKIGMVLEVMGGKVIAIEKMSTEKGGCGVLVKDKGQQIVKKMSNLFSCKLELKDTNFDLEVKLGSDFLF